MVKEKLITIAIVIISLAVVVAAVVMAFPKNKKYTVREVAAHNQSSDCWAIVNGSVYNLSNLKDSHPGGKKAILAACGKDASDAFNTKGGKGPHSTTKADQFLENLKVGEL